MRNVLVTLPDGRVVDGKITTRQKMYAAPVLIAEGKLYSGLDAVSQGLSLYPVNDPAIDRWLNTFSVGG